MRCASCDARVPRGALICARCEAPLSLTHEPDKAPYDVPPSDPEPGNGPGPGSGDPQVGVDVRDDASGDRLWTRPGVDAPALCGDRLVLGDRAALNQGDNSQPQQLTVVDSWSGRPVSQFTTGGSALFTMFCAPGNRLVVLEPTRVRTIDLSTGKDLADVGTGGAFADPMGDGLLISDLTSQTLRLVR